MIAFLSSSKKTKKCISSSSKKTNKGIHFKGKVKETKSCIFKFIWKKKLRKTFLSLSKRKKGMCFIVQV